MSFVGFNTPDSFENWVTAESQKIDSPATTQEGSALSTIFQEVKVHFDNNNPNVNNASLLGLCEKIKAKADSLQNKPLAEEVNSFIISHCSLARENPSVEALNNQLKEALNNFNLSEIVKYLSKGADPNTRNELGQTALHVIAKSRRIDYMGEIVKKNYAFDTSIQDNQGKTPLHVVIDEGLYAIIPSLMKSQNNVLNIKDNDGITPWNMLSRDVFCPPVILASVILSNIHSGIQDKDGGSLLDWAFREKKVHAILEMLKSEDFDVNTQDREGRSPLHVFIEGPIPSTDSYTIDYLLSKREVNVNIQDKDGKTPLHLAVKKGEINSVSMLLKKEGIDPSIKDHAGKTPLNLLLETKYPSLAKTFGEADINAQDAEGKTLLHLMLEKGDAMAAFLLMKNKDINLNIQDNEGLAPLHVAVSRGFRYLNHMINAKGINLNIQDNKGLTPLLLAIIEGKNEDIITALLDNDGTTPNIADYSGGTPFFYAIKTQYPRFNTIDLLIKRNITTLNNIPGAVDALLNLLTMGFADENLTLLNIALKTLSEMYASSDPALAAVINKLQEYQDPQIRVNVSKEVFKIMANDKGGLSKYFVEEVIREEESKVFTERLLPRNNADIQALNHRKKLLIQQAKAEKDPLTKEVYQLTKALGEGLNEAQIAELPEISNLNEKIKEIEARFEGLKKEIDEELAPLQEKVERAIKLKRKADKISSTAPEQAKAYLKEAKELLDVEKHLTHRAVLCSYLIRSIAEGVPEEDVRALIKAIDENIDLKDTNKHRTILTSLTTLLTPPKTFNAQLAYNRRGYNILDPNALTNSEKFLVLKKIITHLDNKVKDLEQNARLTKKGKKESKESIELAVKETLDVIMLIQTLLNLDEAGKLKELAKTSADPASHLKNSLTDILSSKLNLKGVNDVADKFLRTFRSFRNPEAILIYCGTLTKAYNKEILTEPLSTFVSDVLEGRFLEKRYDLDQSVHLKTVFGGEAGAELLKIWRENESLPVEKLVQNKSLSTDSIVDYLKIFKEKIVSDKHLGDYWEEAYPHLAKGLRYRDSIQGCLEAVSEELNTLKERSSSSSEVEDESTKKQIDSLEVQKQILILCQNKNLGREGQLAAVKKALDSLDSTTVELKNDLRGILKSVSSEKKKVFPDFNYTICDTDDPCDILLMGHEITNSCQRLDGDSHFNQGLLGPLLDGKYRIIAVKNEKGEMVARCLLKILWDDVAGKPVLFQERLYINQLNNAYHAELLNEMCKRKAEKMGLDLLAVLFSNNSKDTNRYPNPISSLGGRSPVEYVDALSLSAVTGNTYKIPDAKFL
jgi:ankyrin repeat protein